MVKNVSVRCICFAVIMIGAPTVSAKTLYLDEVEVKAELPKEPYDSFFRAGDLVDKRWLPRGLATVERERLALFRATEAAFAGLLVFSLISMLGSFLLFLLSHFRLSIFSAL